MGLFATALLAANLALSPANVRKGDNNVVLAHPITYSIVTIDDQGKTYINTTPVDREQLLPAIMQLHTRAPKIVFALNPDGKALLLDVVKIMIMMQSEGVETSLAQPHFYSHPVKALDNIPKSNPKLNLGQVSTPGSLAIGIDDAGKPYINENSIELTELSFAIKQQYEQESKTAFLINATSKTFYGDAAQVMGMLKLSGVKSATLNIALPNNQSNIALPLNICPDPDTPALSPPSEWNPRPYIPCLQPRLPDR
jgi:biopolymer transport protein ExbD